ncbi:MAG: MoaD/ThiS family protein [Candidatus Bathyarchaeota archaeon]|nr:MoaD/ThiS family protein [Candidatus Bathyarchaeota archaeon]
MIVKVRFYSTLRELAGSREEELTIIEDLTLADLIEVIASKYEKALNYLYQKGEIRKTDPSIYFLINGRNSRSLSGLHTKLKNNDVVEIIPVPPMVGGG